MIIMYFLIFPIVGVRGRPPSESNISIQGLRGGASDHMMHLLQCNSPQGLVYHTNIVMEIIL